MMRPANTDNQRRIGAGDRLAAAWGFAEATFFFIVPDVLLTDIAIRRGRDAAIRASFVAAVAALAGAAVMYGLGVAAPVESRAAMDWVPGIGPAMIADVLLQVDYNEIVPGRPFLSSLLAVFKGPVTGTPYKLYALQAGDARLGLLPFLIVSFPARLGRFAIVSLAAAFVSRTIGQRLRTNHKRAVAAALWAVFYAIYFTSMT